MLELYGSDGKTLILANDDAGSGLGAALVYTATSSGPRYVRVRQYNSNLTGDDTQYQIQLQANEPPTPTPSPTPIVVPTATPSPTPAAAGHGADDHQNLDLDQCPTDGADLRRGGHRQHAG